MAFTEVDMEGRQPVLWESLANNIIVTSSGVVQVTVVPP